MLSRPFRSLPSPPPSHLPSQAELAVLALLHAASPSPEELLWSAVDTLRLGLLSKETAYALCASLGVTADVLEALLDGGAAAPTSTALVPAAATGPVLSERMKGVIAGAGPSVLNPPVERPVVGLSSFGLQSRLSAEFVLLRKLGHGAMGSVFQARHRLDGGQYAIKIVPFFVRAQEEPHKLAPEAERVLREVQAFSRLNHGNVCRYYSAWVETDWASLWKGQSAAAPSAVPARTPLLLTGGRAECSVESSSSGSSDGSEPTWSQSDESCADFGFVRDSAVLASFGEWGGHRGFVGPRVGTGFELSLESSDGLSFISSSSPSVGESTNSGPSMDGGSVCSIVGPHAPSLGRQWSYRKALLIQMELCENSTLHDYLVTRDAALTKRGGAGVDGIKRAESLDLLLQIVSGLEHVHTCGLVHRDLKPANCCFQRGALKLLDFGLAKTHDVYDTYAPHEADGAPASPADEDGRRDGSKRQGSAAVEPAHAGRPLSHRGKRQGARRASRAGLGTVGVGTASYSAPEQLEHGVSRMHCDMFPVGLIAYELFNPFGSAMERAKHFGQLRSGIVPAEFVSRYPRLAKLIGRLLSTEPKARPLCEEVLSELLEIKHEWDGADPAPMNNVPSFTRDMPANCEPNPATSADPRGSAEQIKSPLLPPTSGRLSPLLAAASIASSRLAGATAPQSQQDSASSGSRGARALKPEPLAPSSLVLSDSLSDRQKREASARAVDEEVVRLRLEMRILTREMRMWEGGTPI